jgi:ABC-type transport system involved in multi-copper enzyme maturation permease subunit
MSANAALLVPSRSRGWRMGLANMLAKENRAWWRTRRWWTQCLLWLFFLNGSMAANLANGQYPENAILNFLYVAGAVVPIAAIILGQDSILGERHSGTTAWVLSKPLRRPAFILAKLIAYGFGFLATGVVFPGVIAYFYITVFGKLALSVAGFAGAMGLVYLNLLFYLTLALMLATLFHGRGPVLGITLFLVWSWMLPPSVWLADVMPWRLLIALGDHGVLPPLGGYLVRGLPLPTVIPIIATVLWCALFVAVAIWRIRREEF